MSILADIEAKILELEGGTFQALCDTYLLKKLDIKILLNMESKLEQ